LLVPIRLMKKGAIHILRLALIALAFQVLSPLFVSVVSIVDDFSSNQIKTALHAETHSVSAPALLKEKDESETEEHHFDVELIPLIDFSRLASVLSEHHKEKITPFASLQRIDCRPSLYTLHSVFLI
jgi:hypothetical protein